jgi:outer membrane protein
MRAGMVLCLFTLKETWGQTSAPPDPSGLTLSGLVRRVLEHNELVQGKLLEFEVNRRKYAAEWGAFEPELFGSASREYNKRQNNTQQAAADNGVTIFKEQNTLYSAGIESLVPTGTRVRLGYTLSDLNNNIPAGLFQTTTTTGSQFQSFAGVTIIQPLLRNFGTRTSLASARLAALSSQIAFQEYRRQLMTMVSQAEATYWSLHLAQEQVRFFEESVRTSETILHDNRTRLDAGKGSELEVMESEAGAGLRRAKLNEARQKLAEAVNRVYSLYGEAVAGPSSELRAVENPELNATLPTAETRQDAFTYNPDYLIQQEKMQQEMLRLGYARNQRLPQFDLKGAYGVNGLGASPSDSYRAIDHTRYPSWSFGAEFHIPLFGDIKGRNEVKAAQLRLTAAELGIHSAEVEILNGMNIATQKVERARNSVANYQSAVNYNQRLLQSALTRLDSGKIESRKVLEIEADVLEAKNSVVESLVGYKVAQLELELITGTVLEHRRLEITQKQLQAATEKFTQHRKEGDSFQHTLDQVHALYPAYGPPAPPPMLQRPPNT